LAEGLEFLEDTMELKQILRAKVIVSADIDQNVKIPGGG
jgi:hypothetical protein